MIGEHMLQQREQNEIKTQCFESNLPWKTWFRVYMWPFKCGTKFLQTCIFLIKRTRL